MGSERQKEFAKRRKKMVERYISHGYLKKNSPLTKAMQKIPREFFVPEKYENISYEDEPLPIPPFSGEQTISAPYTYPIFYRPLDLKEGDSFFEIGAGSGYGAALAREVVGGEGKVVTTEIQPETCRFAEENLREAGYDDVNVIKGDGSIGCKEEAPFDKICVTAAAPDFPPPLRDQLAATGKIVAPIGSPSPSIFDRGQDLVLLERDIDGEEHRGIVDRVIYVPRKGKHGRSQEK